MSDLWRFCLPHRIVELDYQQDEVVWDEPPCRRNSRITSTNKAPPVIASVCRESRAVAFESGCPEPLPSPNNEDAQDFNYNMVRNRWLDTTRDFVHTNWDPFYDIEWQSYDWGDPVRCLMWYAARTESRQLSFTLGLLQCFQHHPNQPHDHYRWTRSELADLLRTNPSWTVIILPPVIVHADAETAAGLFGLLADARVQLVAADDKARIEEFLALDTAPNTTIGAGVGPEDLVSAKLKLRDAIDAVFGSEDSAPVMRPAVMFRLCTGRCP
ncbi:hypothetical protein J7T55_014702 [Diaporthe amygdali]|uniref:uncharacterized protein n=1 Tax=Phomopsis amygdali TaxID=1214568 RepID=UPI0022FE0C98|nr:uncharacterized protein J7T55_014702 [Diaporthe amygdali]KAJ0107172.1 hypothetical protein J7T55_014702 [Diaporthe amygdali]